MTQYAQPFDGPQIARQILNTRLANLIGYWKLDELSGDTVLDYSGSTGRDGTGTGITRGVLGPELTTKATSFDSVNDVVNVYSSGLAGAFNGNTGTISIWVKVNAAAWTDGVAEYAVRVSAGGGNETTILITTANILTWVYAAGGTTKSVGKTTTTIDWVHLVLTWDKPNDQMKAYFNGIQEGTTQVGLGVWAGVPAANTTIVGAASSSGVSSWDGYIAHVAVWDVALSDNEVFNLYTYTAAMFSRFLYYIGDFVIPTKYTKSLATLDFNDSDPLKVWVDGAVPDGIVRVTAGKAVVKGILYELDADTTLPITAAANNRIDRIVLRYSESAKTVRLTVVAGAVAANPSPPTIAATDLPLAWVWVPSGFNPAADAISPFDVHDERIFWPTGEESTQNSSQNLLYNSEFIAYSQPAAGNVAPEGWRLTAAAPASVLGASLLTNQPRGRSIRIQGDDGEGITTQFKTPTNKMYTLRGVVNVTSGTAKISHSSTVTIIRRTGVNQEFIIRVNRRDTDAVPTPEETILTITGGSVGSDFNVGPLIFSQGFVPGYYRHKHELIMLDTALTDAAWAATAKSTGVTLLDLTASFGNTLTADTPIRGLILRLRGNDSASAGTACEMYTTADPADAAANRLSYLRLEGVPNDKIRDVSAFVPMVGGMGTTFYVGVIATGVGTLDATVEILGLIT